MSISPIKGLQDALICYQMFTYTKDKPIYNTAHRLEIVIKESHSQL